MAVPTKVAAIDCGTNSIRLLIASRAADGSLVDHDRRLELVRLGEGVDATGRFSPAALERTFAACDQYAAVIRDLGAERVRFVATSAARDVLNRDEFTAGVRARLGADPEVIPGTEEASLSFSGAMSGVQVSAEPAMVIDCGGGSTELVLGRQGSGGPVIESSDSLDVGSVRLRERFLHDDPPTAEQIRGARALVREMLDGSAVDPSQAATVIGVAGTLTSLSAIHQGLKVYDREKVHASRLTTDEIRGVAEVLLASTVDQVEAMGPLKRRRAEVICAGALIVEEIAARMGADEIIISESDILDGIAAQMLDG
ncbi:Ppx/GppA phosphatase family protein [Acidipropionibacterium virtanenii]|uniref:Guanosine-5'-triphosphate,3'-diphosphate pyrophosphatase n=1 Tax=Acidipropionibacterium virtanenii TaxID=2057246 RepID=A0A344UW10_9ACTN|nr:Ppx/GppA phosphatase family protein [Acidipropionibacterium virtanenii]AXE39458.1 Guanosine-5'-triphosphate,3'-diphosphate pyrophosphatase [Acidipropionibacterium virtanenii]